MTVTEYDAVSTEEPEDTDLPVVGQPVVVQRRLVQRPAQNEWTVGLCGCCDRGNAMQLCCNVYWCFPCMIGRVHSALENKPDHMNPVMCCTVVSIGVLTATLSAVLPLVTNGAVSTTALNMVGLGCVMGVVSFQREELRKKHGIRGGEWGDCVASLCCPVCAVMQHHTELTEKGTNPGYCCCEASAEAPDGHATVQPGYQVD